MGSGSVSSACGVAYDQGEFVAVGVGGLSRHSGDGVSWSAATTGATTNLWSIASGNGLFAAVGDAGTIVTSTNLVDWTWLAQFPSTNATMPFVDFGAANYSRRFYRGQWW